MSLERPPLLIMNNRQGNYVINNQMTNSKGLAGIFGDIEKQPYQLNRLINRQQLKVQNLELQQRILMQ